MQLDFKEVILDDLVSYVKAKSPAHSRIVRYLFSYDGMPLCDCDGNLRSRIGHFLWALDARNIRPNHIYFMCFAVNPIFLLSDGFLLDIFGIRDHFFVAFYIIGNKLYATPYYGEWATENLLADPSYREKITKDVVQMMRNWFGRNLWLTKAIAWTAIVWLGLLLTTFVYLFQ